MSKPHIRLFTGYWAFVKYPSTKIQRSFGCYSTTQELFAIIAATAPPT